MTAKALTDKQMGLLMQIESYGGRLPAKQSGQPLVNLWTLEERGLIILYDRHYMGTLESTRLGLTPFGRQLARMAMRTRSEEM
jgi:hypothetical protein